MRNKIIICLLASSLIAFASLGVHNVTVKDNKIKFQKVELQDTATKLQILEGKYQQLNVDLEHKTKSLEQVESERQQIQQEKEELAKQLSLKQEAQRLAAQKVNTVAKVSAVAAAAPVAVGGSCSDWLAQAGIAETTAVRALIAGESGCNPNSVNRSSGACGIAQELPCGKSGCALGDGPCQLRWMNGYVKGRYGSWEGAYATWLSRSPHWY